MCNTYTIIIGYTRCAAFSSHGEHLPRAHQLARAMGSLEEVLQQEEVLQHVTQALDLEMREHCCASTHSGGLHVRRMQQPVHRPGEVHGSADLLHVQRGDPA